MAAKPGTRAREQQKHKGLETGPHVSHVLTGPLKDRNNLRTTSSEKGGCRATRLMKRFRALLRASMNSLSAGERTRVTKHSPVLAPPVGGTLCPRAEAVQAECSEHLGEEPGAHGTASPGQRASRPRRLQEEEQSPHPLACSTYTWVRSGGGKPRACCDHPGSEPHRSPLPVALLQGQAWPHAR